MLIGLLVPIYSDEVGWRFQARAAIDGGVDRFVAEACGPNTLAAPPAFMLPVRAIAAGIDLAFADPAIVRLGGVACALLWLVLLWRLIAGLGRSSQERQAMALLAFPLAATGVLPFMLVLSRPEQPILLALTLALLMTLAGRSPRGAGVVGAWARAAIVLLCAALALSYHLKAVLYVPVFLLCAALTSKGQAGRWPRRSGVIAIAGLTLWALPYWIDRFRCPGDPLIAAKLAQENIASLLVGSGRWGARIGKVLDGASPLHYVRLAAPSPAHMSAWLPSDTIGAPAARWWRKAILLCWDAALLLGLGLLARATWRERRWDPWLLLSAGLAATVLLWGAMQLNKNAYEAALTLPVLILALVLAVRAAGLGDVALRWIGRAGWVLSLFSLANMLGVAALYGPRLWNAAAQPGYVAGQPYSLNAWHYGAARESVEAAARACGIRTDRGSQAVLIDDLTYFAMMRSFRPLHRTGVLSDWNGSITDPAAYLRARHSSGILLGCAYLPASLRGRALNAGPVCCIAGADL